MAEKDVLEQVYQLEVTRGWDDTYISLNNTVHVNSNTI